MILDKNILTIFERESLKSNLQHCLKLNRLFSQKGLQCPILSLYMIAIYQLHFIYYTYSFDIARDILFFWTTYHLIQLSARAKVCEWQRKGEGNGKWPTGIMV